jgi:DNA primase
LINKDTIQNILETARIEEVIGDFVTLKKRGVNLIGLCPFHTEKTPSFTVSATKGIYKCFGCGKAGNAVNFMMEHEHLSYPDALRYLAKKYFIEITEERETPEQLLADSEKESMMHVTAFAQQYFSRILSETDEGKAVGLSYFKERGFDEKIIEKFQLGYSPSEWNGFTKTALENGYKQEYLVSSGLTIAKDEQLYDRFRERVIFPIHNLSGRVIAFGGRTLSSDKTKAKYVNSPESEIYHKSNVLYGIYFAKSSVIAHDNCYLVEGYTDVISLHLAGIENVVASSGTSLTVDQIKLIRRYTPNVTILYDGDAAGIKASFRGIDMILEEGMNVKIVLFPDGEDPDSFARKHRSAEVRDFIQHNAKDFITFKAGLLISETDNDPIKKANLIKEIVGSISLIPDAIIRSVYTRECSAAMKVPEQTLINELNKLRRKKSVQRSSEIAEEQEIPVPTEFTAEQQIETEEESTESLEKELCVFLLNYGENLLAVDIIEEDGEKKEEKIGLANYIVSELEKDEIEFQTPVYQALFNEYIQSIHHGKVPGNQFFINHPDPKISAAAIELLFNPYQLANWEKHKINVFTEDSDLVKSTLNKINKLKLKIVSRLLTEMEKELKTETREEEIMLILTKYKRLKELQKEYAGKLTTIIIK